MITVKFIKYNPNWPHGINASKHGEFPSGTRQIMATKIGLCLRLCNSSESATYLVAGILY